MKDPFQLNPNIALEVMRRLHEEGNNDYDLVVEVFRKKRERDYEEGQRLERKLRLTVT